MKIECKLKKSIKAAQEFIDSAQEALDSFDDDPAKKWRSKEVATAKRRSMDLSNQLIDLRKSSAMSH